MKVPKYIREKMHRIALHARMVSDLDREVGIWLEQNGIDVEKLSDGGGSGYEELSYQCKADTAFQNYQETGITRYDTARRNNEDMAEALRMAASAKEDHDRMIHLRGVLSQLAWRAAEANRASEEDRPRKMQAVLGELLSAARMQGLIRDEGGDFK